MNALMATIPTPTCVSSRVSHPNSNYSNPRSHFPGKPKNPHLILQDHHLFTLFSTSTSNDRISGRLHCRRTSHFYIGASSFVGSAEYTEEPATSVKFQKSLTLPGCSGPLSLLGIGYREKTFAIIGVKVYAVGLYINKSILNGLSAWKGRLAAEIEKDASLFDSIYQALPEKSLQIVLVRDVDGKTFWDAFDEAISPRIKSPSAVDGSALSTFRSIFQGKPLKKGTAIFLTWPGPSKILVCVSSGGMPSNVDATIESGNVASALFDVFFGGAPVSPSLKSSVVKQIATQLK